MSTLNEKTYVGDVLRWEDERNFSRLAATVVAVAALSVGTPLGQNTKSSVVSAAGANTGSGVMGTVTLGALAMPGVYKLKCITAATNAGTFSVLAPDGKSLPNLTVAAAYASDHLNMTLADGATDFIVGDTFAIAVSGDGKYYPCVYGALDGTGEAKAILLQDVPISTGIQATLLVRQALIAGAYLNWPASYDSDAKKLVATNQLLAQGIALAAANL